MKPDTVQQLRTLRHNLANSLHGVFLQARGANAHLDDGDPQSAKESLALIEQAVNEANALVDELAQLAHNGSCESDEPS